MEVLEWPNGICQKHGAKLNVNGIPKCVKCEADAERATRAPAPVVNVVDPGHEKMGAIAPDGRIHTKVQEADKSVNNAKPAHLVPSSLAAIKDAIYALPMPKSLKQYKRFQKIQQLIDQAVEEDNAQAD